MSIAIFPLAGLIRGIVLTSLRPIAGAAAATYLMCSASGWHETPGRSVLSGGGA